MMEVLTKRFWQDVKKTFNEALEGTPVKASYTGGSTEAQAGNVASSEGPTPPKQLNEIAGIEESPNPKPCDS
jgi:hypothetical protein